MKESLLLEAVREWVGTFNAIPLNLVKRAYCSDGEFVEGFTQLTGRQWECEKCGPVESQQSRVVKLQTRLGLDTTHHGPLIAKLRCPQCDCVGPLCAFDGVTYGNNGLPAWSTL